MKNDIVRGPLANSLALHDFKKKPIDMKGLFYFIEEWFHKADLIPNRISGEAGKNVNYDGRRKKLERTNFAGLDGFWIGALPPEVGTEMFDGIFMVFLHRHIDNNKMSIVLSWDDQIINFNLEYIENLARGLSQFLEPTYGYAYQREFDKGPLFYPFGVISGIDSFSEEAEQITKWGNEYAYATGGYKTGDLRDIYPLNFLSEEHLKRDIHGEALKEWIESSPDHGTLKTLTELLWSWRVPENKIDQVRESLRDTAIILRI